MDVKTAEMNGALDNVYSTAIDNGEVANLLNEMRDQQQIVVNVEIRAGTEDIAVQPTAVANNDMDAMQDVLALRPPC